MPPRRLSPRFSLKNNNSMKKDYLKPVMEVHQTKVGSFLIGVSGGTPADPNKPTYANERLIEVFEGEGGAEGADEDLW